ncbi:LOW QUALITY PROTEIN: hypothetical protein MC885_008511 [Smutsia gigantea]|nr:LOW QUALITY PROTEIN: hypothetical protein MC885_008511 [Smutsia gigantea]
MDRTSARAFPATLWCRDPQVEYTAARTSVAAHRCQDPARAPVPAPASSSPSPSPSSLSIPSSSYPSVPAPQPAPSGPDPALQPRPSVYPQPLSPRRRRPGAPRGPRRGRLRPRAPREPVRADCGHRFCRACVVRFWAEEDGPFPCPECADDCWQRAVEPGRPPLSRRLLALEEAAAAPARDGPASEAALQLLCRADAGPLCAACRMATEPEPPEWEPRWRKALRGKESKGSVETMRKDLNDARDLHGQAESAAAVWKASWGPVTEQKWVLGGEGVWGHVMDRRKKALADYKKLRAFFAEEEERFLQEADKEEGSLEDKDMDPEERFRSLLQTLSELERRHRNLGLSMLLQQGLGVTHPIPDPKGIQRYPLDSGNSR